MLTTSKICIVVAKGHSHGAFFTGRNEVLAKVIFSEACVILSTGGGGVCSKFSGGCLLQIFGGGVCSKFSGGVSAPNFPGGGVSPIFGIQSTFGRYASYWNAFLFLSATAFFNQITEDRSHAV